MLDPTEYPENCFHHIVAINRELANIATLERLKRGPYADSADDIDELISMKDQRISDLCRWVEIEVRESILERKKTILLPFVPHGLYAREDIARHDGSIREGYESLNVLYAKSTEIYELALEDGVLIDDVLPALERHKILIDQTNDELAKQIDKVR